MTKFWKKFLKNFKILIFFKIFKKFQNCIFKIFQKILKQDAQTNKMPRCPARCPSKQDAQMPRKTRCPDAQLDAQMSHEMPRCPARCPDAHLGISLASGHLNWHLGILLFRWASGHLVWLLGILLPIWASCLASGHLVWLGI